MATHRVLHTGRLTLLPADAARLQILLSGAGAFELVTGLKLAEGFCPFAGALATAFEKVQRAKDAERPWWTPRMFVLAAERRVIGLGGFKGPPSDGIVEIGYAVAPAYQCKGVATEAAQALVAHAFEFGEVEKVVAHTLATPSPSTRVLEKCGFARTGETLDPADGLVWRWEHSGRTVCDPSVTPRNRAE